MQKLILVIIMIFITVLPVQADSENDIAAIKRTARNYMESWYQGDAKKMEEVLCEALAKRCLQPGYGDKRNLRQISASDMISWTKSGYGKPLWAKDMNIEVTVLDFRNNIASVKAITPHYYEYLHLAKKDEKWVIVNTLYEKDSPPGN